jgi:AcrR family transcriptional regulator
MSKRLNSQYDKFKPSYQGGQVAKIDLIRRAQIGLGRRAKNRAQIMRAARALYSTRAIDAVTVHDVTLEAGVAKGTFYAHFRSLDDLHAAIAEELAQSFDGFVEPRQVAIDDPIERIAAGCTDFIGQALRDPAWGALTARGAWAFPRVAGAARERFRENLRHVALQGRLAPIPAEVGFDIVMGIVLQAMRSASESRLSASDVPLAVRGTLRALGVSAGEADRIVDRLSEPPRAAARALV